MAKWVAYINRKKRGSVVTEKKHFDYPSTSMADTRAACALASELFKAPMSAILCMPDKS